MPHALRGTVVPACQDSIAYGEALQARVPPADHRLLPRSSRRDPLALLAAQDKTRLKDLLPLRYFRMSRSPFAFYRGSAAVMAHDLARTPRTGLLVQACGDAHLANFGIFATPERTLVFDLNDFDETVLGPWEWDVKRLATSIRLAARDNGLSESQGDDAIAFALEAYRTHMDEYARQRILAVWYAQLDRDLISADASRILSKKQQKKAQKALSKVKLKDSLRALRKLTKPANGTLRLAERPPVLEHVGQATKREIEQEMDAYLASLPSERRMLVNRFTILDYARKVVGVGSVGTRCYIVLMRGRTLKDPLFLQLKEAQASVLEAYGFRSEFRNHGERVVHGQRSIQAASDIFLGWFRVGGHDFYVRQLADEKGSVDVENMSAGYLKRYSGLCGWALARAHARTGNPARLAGYMGKGARFDDAILEFSRAYADQSERDHALLQLAIRAGRIVADDGVAEA
jgi:uncharacterized protein (DUF2252 family)